MKHRNITKNVYQWWPSSQKSVSACYSVGLLFQKLGLGLRNSRPKSKNQEEEMDDLCWRRAQKSQYIKHRKDQKCQRVSDITENTEQWRTLEAASMTESNRRMKTSPKCTKLHKICMMTYQF